MRLGEERRHPANRREWLVAFGHEIGRIPVWAGVIALLAGAAIGARCQR